MATSGLLVIFSSCSNECPAAPKFFAAPVKYLCAKLFIDGGLIISNDGIHGPTAKLGSVFLSKGAHQLRVPYFQGLQHHVALVLEVAQQGEALDLFNTQAPLGAHSDFGNGLGSSGLLR